MYESFAIIGASLLILTVITLYKFQNPLIWFSISILALIFSVSYISINLGQYFNVGGKK